MADFNYHEILEQDAEKMGDRLWLLFEDDRLSYAAVNQAANRAGHALEKLGLGPGQGWRS